MSEAEGRSIRLFLADGTPHGLIVAEIINWSGKVLSVPRGRVAELFARPEAGRTGLYLLVGPDPDRSMRDLAYIGETDEIGKRLKFHLSSGKLDFFDRVAVIVSSDDNLTKAHVRYVESQLIRMAREAGKVSLANDREPDFQRLPEADRADMDFFVRQVGLVLPTLGFDLFRARAETEQGTPSPSPAPIFTFETAGASA